MVFNIISKEVKELLTKSTIISLIVISVILGSIGKYTSNSEKELITKKTNIAVYDMDSTDISLILSNSMKNFSNEDFSKKSYESVFEDFKKNEGIIVLIEKGFKDSIMVGKKGEVRINWFLKGVGIFDFASSDIFENVIRISKFELMKNILKTYRITDENVLDPVKFKNESIMVKGKIFKNISPKTLYSTLQNQTNFIPVIIMMLLIMSGSMIISSMGLEKENKTLETLLTMPLKREDIVLGKIIGGGVVGIIMAAIYMFGFYNYMKGFTGNLSTLTDLKVFNIFDYTLTGLSIFLSLLSGLSMCLLLGLFARDYKSAQTLTLPVSILAIIPMFLTMFKDFETINLPLKLLVFIIPFSHPILSLRFLFFDQYQMVYWGIIYNLLFFIILTYFIVKIFNTDYVITGKNLFIFNFNKRKFFF